MLNRSDCQLRLMNEGDATLLLSWRNQERIRANMYTDHVIGVDEHLQWIRRAISNEDSRYLIFEWRKRPAGFISLTGIDPRQGRALWAFYLGESTLPRGAGMAMEFLALEYAFETLGIRKLMCEVFAFNAPVLKMHTRFGFLQEALFHAHAQKDGESVDVIGLALFRDAWFEIKVKLVKLVFFNE